MASIILTSPVFYKSGAAGVSAVVGYESLSNRVVRYSLRTGLSGAGRVSLAFTGNWKGSGTLPKLNFYIGTDPDSHAGAGAGSPYTGTLSPDGFNYSGSAEVLLLPDTDYYVWVFPATEVFGWVQWSYSDGAAVADCTGGALTVLTAEAGVMGQPMTLQLTRYADFAHTVTCTLGSQTLTVCENSTETALQWTPPEDLACQLPNAASGTAVFTVTSLRDGEAVGSTGTTAVLTVPDSAVPTVAARWRDESGAFDTFGTCVQLVSRVAVEADGAGCFGSTIVSTALTLNGKPYTGDALRSAGDVTLTVTVTDSRGRKGSDTHIFSVAAYAVPWVRIDASRCDADGTANDMGEYAAVTLTGQSTQIAEKNRAVLTFAHGETAETIAVSAGSFQERRIIPADSTQTLSLWAELADQLTASPRASMVLSIGYATVDFYAGGKGIAFGTTATKEGFTCAMDADFSGHRVSGLPDPAARADAATKGYVDGAVQQVADRITPGAVPESVAVSANTPVPVSMAEGELAHISFVADVGSGDVFLLVNGTKPTLAAYSFSDAGGHFSDGQITYAGSAPAVFDATVQLHGGHLIVSGRDIRGNGTGLGQSVLVWSGLEKLSSLSFSQGGNLLAANITVGTLEQEAAAAVVTEDILLLSGGDGQAEIVDDTLVLAGSGSAAVIDGVLILEESET